MPGLSGPAAAQMAPALPGHNTPTNAKFHVRFISIHISTELT